MRSTLLALAFLVAVGGLMAQAPQPVPPQPDPKAQPPVPPTPAALVSDYFPAKKGTKWTYKYAESDVVMEVKDSAGEVKIDTLSNGKVVASESLKLVADGANFAIYRTKINTLDITDAAGKSPGLKILELENKGGKLVPAAKGKKWTVDVKVQQAQLKGEYTIGDTTKVKLPVGEVDATLVEAKLNIGGTDTTVRYWFAADKGQVKVSYTIANNEQAMELKTFEPAK